MYGFQIICLDSSMPVTGLGRRPNLGLIVYTLRQAADQFLHIFDSHKQHVRKMAMLGDLATEELKEVRKDRKNYCIIFKIYVGVGHLFYVGAHKGRVSNYEN